MSTNEPLCKVLHVFVEGNETSFHTSSPWAEEVLLRDQAPHTRTGQNRSVNGPVRRRLAGDRRVQDSNAHMMDSSSAQWPVSQALAPNQLSW